jgi:hypothetical protein
MNEDLPWYKQIPNINLINEEDLKFIFSQAEKLLDDTTKNFDSTTAKSNNIVAVVTTILTALTSYFFLNFSYQGTYNIEVTIASLSIIYFAFPTFFIFKNILSTGYCTIGSRPDKLISNLIFSDDTIKNKDTHRTMLLSEIIDYKRRIEDNIYWNRERTINLDRSIKFVLFYPFVIIIAYFFCILISEALL